MIGLRTACGAAALWAGVALAQVTAPAPIIPDNARWMSPPNLPGVRGAWVLGAQDKPGL